MLDRLRTMAVFQAVAETGSFRGAAKKLALSPSVVSHHVTQLETHLGLALLYRSTRRVSLTDAGREFLGATQAMSEAAERGLTAMRLRANQPVGNLRITCHAALQFSPYIEAFSAFGQQHPQVKLSINFTMKSIRLEGSRFDLALRASPFGLNDSTYKARKLFEFRTAYVASPAYANVREPVRGLSDLFDWDRIMFPPTPLKAIYAFTGINTAHPIAPPRIETDNPEAARRFILDGLGFGILDYNMVRADLEAGRLVQILAEARPPAIPLWAIWPSNAGRDSLVHRFVDFIAPRWARLNG